MSLFTKHLIAIKLHTEKRRRNDFGIKKDEMVF